MLLNIIASHEEVHAVMAAIVGAAGLAPCLAAARAGKRLLLANKEALVVGGELFMATVREGGARLLPIDSEHSAIFQSLPEDPATWDARVDKIILTASGGPFRTRASGHAAPCDARRSLCASQLGHGAQDIGGLGHHDEQGAGGDRGALPVWPASPAAGGGDPPAKRHPLHGPVPRHLRCGAARHADMRVPIAYGLSWPDRIESGAQALDFSRLADMSFESFDSGDHRLRFPGLQLAWEVLEAVPGTPAVLNAANEVAVAAFLDRRIRFDQIHDVNLATLDAVTTSSPESLEQLLALDARARGAAQASVERMAA
jgi:1-deoxy-D-xylulose-5-phosphate reductoisomerase